MEMSALAAGPESEAVDTIVEFARHTGVPRAVLLTALADSLDESDRRERATATGSATANQTSRILLALPLATALGAELFGFGVVATLIATPLGWACVALGVGLNLLAVWWMRRLRAMVPHPPLNTGLALDLAAATASSSGLTDARLDSIKRLTHEWGTGDEMLHIERHRALSRETGIPVAGLLAAEAGLVRHTARADVDHALELLPGRLLGPVGACLFPAFIATTVVPVIASMVGKFTL